MAEFYKYQAGMYLLHRDSSEGEVQVFSEPAMRWNAQKRRMEQINPREKKVPTCHMQIAIAYYADGSIATHGNADQIEAWVKCHNEAAPANSASAYSFPQNHPVETINRALRDPDFFALIRGGKK